MSRTNVMKHRQRRPMSLEKKKALFGYIFVLPVLLGVLFFLLPSLIQSAVIAFCDMKITEEGYKLVGVGLGHFDTIFNKDPNFRKELLSSVTDMLINVPVVVIFSLFIATLLNQDFHGRAVIRSILFLPVIISSGAITQLTTSDIMNNMGSSVEGGTGMDLASVFATFMSNLDIPPNIVQFLVDIVSRVYDITVMSAVPVLILLAGLQAISPSIFEASYVEGATKWEVFWKISFPMVSPLMLVACVYCVIDSFTNVSNPVIDTIHETTFESVNYGLGTAMAWCYMLLIFAILGLVYVLINKRVYYYD